MISVYFDPIIAPPFNQGVMRLYVLNEGRKILTEIKNDFQRTVKTWDHKPKFEKNIGFSTTTLKLEVFTTDENYIRVSDGTSSKPRVAHGAGIAIDGKPRALKILPYSEKTTPGDIDAQPGGYEESPIIFRKYALDAGKIRPRKFDELVFEIWDEELPDRLQVVLDAAANKTGYAF